MVNFILIFSNLIFDLRKHYLIVNPLVRDLGSLVQLKKWMGSRDIGDNCFLGAVILVR